MNEFYYEAEMKELIKENLEKKYELNEKENIFSYLILRFLIKNKNSKFETIKNNKYSFCKFICDELNIPVSDNKIYFRDGYFILTGVYHQSIENIIQEFIFDSQIKNKPVFNNYGECWAESIENLAKEIIKKAKNKSRKIKSKEFCNYFYLYEALNILNTLFKVKIHPVERIEGINYKGIIPSYKRTDEEICDSIIKSYKLDTDDVDIIDEEQLEEFLQYNIEKIEKGLKFKARQYPIKNGVIDLLAVDKNNNDVIIELKVAQDERLIWQAIYYPMAYKEETKKKNIRMITLCPSYEEYILKPLKSLKDVEIMKYDLVIEFGKIKDVYVSKIA